MKLYPNSLSPSDVKTQYLQLSDTVAKLEYFDKCESVLSADKDCTNERNSLHETYTNEFTALRKDLLKKSIFTQRIWDSRGKIYAKDHSGMAWFANNGEWAVKWCLRAGVCSLIFSLAKYTWKIEAFFNPLAFIIATILWFIAAYAVNLGFLMAMAVEASKLNTHIASDKAYSKT